MKSDGCCSTAYTYVHIYTATTAAAEAAQCFVRFLHRQNIIEAAEEEEKKEENK